MATPVIDKPAAEGVLVAATCLVLVAVGALSGLIEAFLVPQRLLGGVEGLSAVLAFVGNGVLGAFGAIGTRNVFGALAPALGWFIAVGVVLFHASHGDVIIPGSLPVDPGTVYAGMAFLIFGVFGAGLGLLPVARFTGPAREPTPPV